MKNRDIVDLYDLMMEQLRDLLDGERQQLEVFPEFDGLADSFELREIVEHHQRETRRQLMRLEKVFGLLEEDAGLEQHCEGIEGLIREARDLAARCKVSQVIDAGLITSIQHINHYEMAGYGTAIAYAKTLDKHDVAELLLQTLREEKSADEELSRIAEDKINVEAKWTSVSAGAETD